MTLEGRVAVITGAASPFARPVAVALAEAGADIALAVESVDETDVFAMNSIANELWALGRRQAAFTLEPGRLADSVARAVAELGRLDVLVSLPPEAQAGSDDLTETAEDSVLAHVQRRLGGALLLSRAAAVAMSSGGGTILNAVNGVGTNSTVDAVAAAAEAGIKAATQALARDWKPAVRVNAAVVRSESKPEALAALAAKLAGTSVTGQVFEL